MTNACNVLSGRHAAMSRRDVNVVISNLNNRYQVSSLRAKCNQSTKPSCALEMDKTFELITFQSNEICLRCVMNSTCHRLSGFFRFQVDLVILYSIFPEGSRHRGMYNYGITIITVLKHLPAGMHFMCID